MRPDNATAITHYKVAVPRGHQPSALVVQLAKKNNKENRMQRKTLYAKAIAYGNQLLEAAAKREETRKRKLEAQDTAASKPGKKRKGRTGPETDVVVEDGMSESHGVVFRLSSIKEQAQSREMRAKSRTK